MTSRPWRCLLLALTLAASSCLTPGEDEETDGPGGAACTTELRPHYDGEGCCGEAIAEPLCSTGTIAYCEVRNSRSEVTGCYYRHSNGTKLRCASCQSPNDCVAEANRVCGK